MRAASAVGRWEAVLFDLDGTLADTVALILASYRHTMRRHLGRTPPDGEWLATIGRPLRDQLEGFARSSDEARAMLATYSEYQAAIHDDMTRPFPGASDVVRTLKERGALLGVVTSKRSRIARRTLECCGLWQHFQVVVCADHVTNGKPHPEAVERAMGLLGVVRPDRTLFVGDSPHDVEAGRRGGVKTAAAAWGPFPHQTLRAAGPDFVVRELYEILELQVGSD